MSVAPWIASPFSTGGGGFHFEASVHAAFLVLLLGNESAPGDPEARIIELHLQCGYKGYSTDDLLIITEDHQGRKRNRLLCQIKTSVQATKSNSEFRATIQNAWKDWQDSRLFQKSRDRILLITGPLNDATSNGLSWISNQISIEVNAEGFFNKLYTSGMTNQHARNAFEAIREHLQAMEGGQSVTKQEIFSFLRDFKWMSMDLANATNLNSILFRSIIYRHFDGDPANIWGQLVDFAQSMNKRAGVITAQNLPLSILQQLNCESEPRKTAARSRTTRTYTYKVRDSAEVQDIVSLALIGRWDSANRHDMHQISKILRRSEADSYATMKTLLQHSNSPLRVAGTTWSVIDPISLLRNYGRDLLDNDVQLFAETARAILTNAAIFAPLPALPEASNSALDHPRECSPAIRASVLETLAFIGSEADVFKQCSVGAVRKACHEVVSAVLQASAISDWDFSSSILPKLAEAAPQTFLRKLERDLADPADPINELLVQENSQFLGARYVVGLIWALEALAWDSDFLFRACRALAEMAERDPGGNWEPRPASALVSILLPWKPQTLASRSKRFAAMKMLLKEYPMIGWRLLLNLLPGSQTLTTSTYRFQFRVSKSENADRDVSRQEFLEHSLELANLSMVAAGTNSERLTDLLGQIETLPPAALNDFLELLDSEDLEKVPQKDRSILYNALIGTINRHKYYSSAEWALAAKPLNELERLTNKLSPKDPHYRYQYLFQGQDIAHFDSPGDRDRQVEDLGIRRLNAIRNIFSSSGIEGLLAFASEVPHPELVGSFLAKCSDSESSELILPSLLSANDPIEVSFIRGYVWQSHRSGGWHWFESLPTGEWTGKEKLALFLCLPFELGTWERADDQLGREVSGYWESVGVNPYIEPNDLTPAIERLVDHRRPNEALSCLREMLHRKGVLNISLCIRALKLGAAQEEMSAARSQFDILELIQYLQNNLKTEIEEIAEVELLYLPLLRPTNRCSPITLFSFLEQRPPFFCELIRNVYESRSNPDPASKAVRVDPRRLHREAMLLHEWKTIPGLSTDGMLDVSTMEAWITQVQSECKETGHLNVANIKIGELLASAPTDPDGFWIHRAVAETLENREGGSIRAGFQNELFNARGIHEVDESGNQERRIAQKYESNAIESEEAGYFRLAETMQDLAKTYYSQADLIQEHFRREDQSTCDQ